MFRYAFWGLLGAIALGSLFLPTAPSAKPDPGAQQIVRQELPQRSLTLSH